MLQAGDRWPAWSAEKDKEILEGVFSERARQSSAFALSEEYHQFTSQLRARVRGRGSDPAEVVAPVYILESPVYFVEHLLPLFLAVPGWLVLFFDGEHSLSNAQLAHERFGIPYSAMLEVDPDEFDLFHCDQTLLLACTEPLRFPSGYGRFRAQWNEHPLAVTLAHGIDEDATYTDGKTLNPAQSPERWRDLRHTHVLQALLQRCDKRCHTRRRSRKGTPGPTPAVHRSDRALALRRSLRLHEGRKTVLYVSTVGAFEFLDKDGPDGLRQQVWQALVQLKRRHNVLVSLHPLLGLSDLYVRMNASALAGGGGAAAAPGAAAVAANASSPWRGRKARLHHALRQQGMLVTQSAGSSMLSLVEIADLVVAPVSSGSASSVLQRPETPLVLLRPRVAWDGANLTAVAAANDGLVLGPGSAVVLDDSMDAALLKATVEGELAAAGRKASEAGVADAMVAAHQARVDGRVRYRRRWFGTVDGYEELRTWLALLITVLESGSTPVPGCRADGVDEGGHGGARCDAETNDGGGGNPHRKNARSLPAWPPDGVGRGSGRWEEVVRRLGPLHRAYAALAVGPLADAADHPLMWDSLAPD